MEYYSATGKNDHATGWMNLKNMLSETERHEKL